MHLDNTETTSKSQNGFGFTSSILDGVGNETTYSLDSSHNINKEPKFSVNSKNISFPSILVTNPQSLTNCFDEFKTMVENEEPDVITVSETWFSETKPARNFQLYEYHMFNDDREDGRRGGGVALFVKSNLQPTEPEIKVPRELECIWASISNQVFLCGIYHPPRASTGSLLMDHLVNAILDIRRRFKESIIIIMGDFNELSRDRLYACLGVKNIVNEPTHGNSTIDLILTDNPDKYTNPKLLQPLGNSSHHCVFVKPK